MRLTGAAVQWSPEFQGNDLKRLHLTCRVTAALAEGRRQLEEQEQEQLRRALEAREEERLRRVLDQLRSWGADCAGVGSQAGPGGSGPLGEAEGPVDTAVFHGAGGDLSGGLPGSPVSRPAEWEERRGGSR